METTNERLIEINDFVKPYFKDNKKHVHYERAIDEYYHLSFHIDGYFRKTSGGDEVTTENPYFKRLIDTQRPSETPAYKGWRRDNFIPENKVPCFRVLNVLKKIIRAEDWKIDFSESIPSRKIKDSETLEIYTSKKYPNFGSVENWVNAYAVKRIISDPNALIVVMPIEYGIASTDYYRPYASIISCKMVLDYKYDQYAIFESDRKCSYYSGDRKYTDGNVIVIMTQNEIWEAEQIDAEQNFTLILRMKHDIGSLPAWKTGGHITKESDGCMLYESFISSVLPGLDKAAREMSDLDAEVIQNIFSTMWRIDGQGCTTCSGNGKVPSKSGQIICPTCDGDGNFSRSPGKEIVIKQNALNPGNLPIPPAGYLQKDTAIVTIQDERIKNHIINSLSSIGLDYLISLAQSGVAKQYDREEANNFVYGFAYHLVENIMNRIYFFSNEFRNMLAVPSFEERQKLLPKINIPQRFDIFSEGVVMAQITNARTAKVDPLIINYLEVDLVSKWFYNSPDVRDKIATIKQCDPLPGLTSLEKSDMILTKDIPLEDFILSVYINAFVEQAIDEVPEFLKKTRKDKLIILYGYSKAKILTLNPVQLDTSEGGV